MTDGCLHCSNTGSDICQKCDQMRGDKALYQIADLTELQRRRKIIIDACFYAIAGR